MILHLGFLLVSISVVWLTEICLLGWRDAYFSYSISYLLRRHFVHASLILLVHEISMYMQSQQS